MTPCCDINISDAGGSLKLGPSHPEGQLSFVCANVLGRSFPGFAELVPLSGAGQSATIPSWLTVASKHEFDCGGTATIVVSAKLPAGTPKQTLQFKLRVSNSIGLANEEYAESRPVSVDVDGGAAPEPPKRPAWLVPAVAAAVVLLLCGGVALALLDKGEKALLAGDLCDPLKSACPVGAPCRAEQKRCLADDGATCTSGSQCLSTRCALDTKLCAAASSPSCSGLAASCGPDEKADCCAFKAVPGGHFERSNRPGAGATVSTFALDRYEVSVGRFRKFVEAYTSKLPSAGAGKNPHDAHDRGWDAAWNASLLPDGTALKAALACNNSTWTDQAGPNEAMPINCLTWFELQAFCIWDGGRLPTEAEWNYAAAAGGLQRVLPWSSPPTDSTIDAEHASLTDFALVGSRSPEGDGLWGHSDLVGNVFEWTADHGEVGDQATPYVMPCVDCAVHTGPMRVLRGGGIAGNPVTRDTAWRSWRMPTDRDYALGGRCARDVPAAAQVATP